MKIGDQVRFLNEIGGGRVAGFQGKNIVLVEDEDGTHGGSEGAICPIHPFSSVL